MKMSKENHDHKITKNLKAILFAFLMFLPVLSVVSTTLYTIFNDNAYQSYDGKETYLQAELKTPTNAVNNFENIKVGNYYLLTLDATKNSDVNTLFQQNNGEVENQLLIDKVIQKTNTTIDWGASTNKELNYVDIFYNTTNIREPTISFSADSLQSGSFTIMTYQNQTLEMIVKILSKTDLKPTTYNLYRELPTEYYEYTAIEKEKYTLNNAFDKAFNELENNKMFSWTKETVIYQGVNNTLNLIQVKNNTLVVLISYWLYLTTIYIIIDIIIESIVFLTHMINIKADKD